MNSTIMKEKYTNTLQQIADLLLAKHKVTEEAGLLYGHAGMSLFLFHYAAKTQHETYNDAAQQLLLEAYKALVKKDKGDVKDDIPGIGWFFLYLTRQELIAIDTDELLESVDTFIFDGIQHRFSPVLGPGGLLSKGAYLVERYQVTASGFKKIMIAEVIAAVVDEVKTKFHQGWPAQIGRTYDRYYSENPQIIWQHKANSISAIFYFLTTLVPLQIYSPIVHKLMKEAREYLYNLYKERPTQELTIGTYAALLRIYHALHIGGREYVADLEAPMAEHLKHFPQDMAIGRELNGIHQPVLIYKLLKQLSVAQPGESTWKTQALLVQEQLLPVMNKRLAGVPNLGLAEGIAGAGMVLLEEWSEEVIPWEGVLLLQGN